MSLGKHNLLIITIILVALFVAIYAPALGHGFVKDDFRWIAAAEVHSPADVARMFSSNVGFYRPLVTLSFAIDRAVWRLDARGYACTNVILLLGNAGLLFLVARRLSMPLEAALLAAAVWAFNFHGIKMAVLWTSGRTALLLCLFSQASALAWLAERRWNAVLAAALALAAMFCKEEAVMLPPLFAALHLLIGSGQRTLHGAFMASWPLWIVAAVYAMARAQSGAFGIWDAPEYYRLTVDPRTVLRNVGEYLDRGATFAVIVSFIFWSSVPRTTSFDDRERGAIRFGFCWFVAMLAITMFIPVRSSLYAVAPSIGSALAAAACASRSWRVAPQRCVRVAASMIVAIALLLPIYRLRNHGLVEPADLATRSLAAIQGAARRYPDAREILLRDNPTETVTLDSAFGALFPDAVHLFLDPAVHGAIVDAAVTTGAEVDAALVFTLREGRLIQEPSVRATRGSRINGTPAASSASHPG